jgi:hypothetical protein
MSDYHEDGHHVGRNNNSLPSYPSGEGSGDGQSPYRHFHCESTHGDTPNRYDPVERQRQELARIDAMLRGDHHL